MLAFVQAADRDIEAMNSFMMVRHGQVVVKPWKVVSLIILFLRLRLRCTG